MSADELINTLETAYTKIKHALDIAKKIEDVDEETVNKVVNLVNEITRMADDVADYIMGLAETEEV